MVIPSSVLNKKMHSISYHYCRENIANCTCRIAKENTESNLADLFTKVMGKARREDLLYRFMYWRNRKWFCGSQVWVFTGKVSHATKGCDMDCFEIDPVGTSQFEGTEQFWWLQLARLGTQRVPVEVRRTGRPDPFPIFPQQQQQAHTIAVTTKTASTTPLHYRDAVRTIVLTCTQYALEFLPLDGGVGSFIFVSWWILPQFHSNFADVRTIVADNVSCLG